MEPVLAIAACYLLGSIPFGVIVGKLAKGIDIRDYGSGNIGASNVLRTLGPALGILVLALDTAKGVGAVEISRGFGLGPWWVVACALTAVLGHTFSVFLKFTGGKGVATSLGIVIALDPVIAAIALGTWAILVALTRYISLASIIASLSVPVQMFAWTARDVPPAYKVLAAVAALTILAKHKSNIKRLLAGTETKIGQRVEVKPEAEGEVR